MRVPLDGLTLSLLPDDPGPEHAAAREFCLAVIKQHYGFDYRQDWHGDLDSLLLSPEKNHYSAANRGAFWTLKAPHGAIAATAAIKVLSWQPTVLADIGPRYSDISKTATLVRAYVAKERRGGGIGKWLNELCESHARASGYSLMYLHASTDAPATIAFWKRCGYVEFGAFGFSTHFDKPLGGSKETQA